MKTMTSTLTFILSEKGNPGGFWADKLHKLTSVTKGSVSLCENRLQGSKAAARRAAEDDYYTSVWALVAISWRFSETGKGRQLVKGMIACHLPLQTTKAQSSWENSETPWNIHLRAIPHEGQQLGIYTPPYSLNEGPWAEVGGLFHGTSGQPRMWPDWGQPLLKQ